MSIANPRDSAPFALLPACKTEAPFLHNGVQVSLDTPFLGFKYLR